MKASGSRNLAVAAILLSAAVISTSGLVIRNLEDASHWQVVFWRGLSLGVVLVLLMLIQHGRAIFAEFRNIGISGVIGGVFNAGALVGYVLAISNTTVANAVFTMSAVPFFTALFAWVILRERVDAKTMLAIAVAATGIALMVGDGIATGTLFGNVMALFAAVSIAGYVVTLRMGRSVNMLPTAVIGALLSLLLAGWMADGKIQISNHDIYLCLLLGVVILGLGTWLFLFASRQLAGAELTLLNMAEFILGPLWVWIFVNEIPSEMTLIGGAIVLIAVAGHALISLRNR